jgi:hypothetical protein
MWFWPNNEISELVSGIQEPQLGDESCECEDQNWSKIQAVPELVSTDVKTIAVYGLEKTSVALCSVPVQCLSYSSTLKKEATCSSETSYHFHRSTRRQTEICEDQISKRFYFLISVELN